MALEDVIKRRIKDQAWDDDVRKEKPKEDPYECKKRLTLDHGKSKLSLTKIYEQEYLKLNQEKAKGGDVKTDAEKTPTDKKRERRKKKLVKRIKLKEKEKRQKLLEGKAEQNPKLKKQVSAAQLRKLIKADGTSLLKDDGKEKALRSSRAFFSRLQDQVKMQIQDPKKSQRKPKKRAPTAQQLKL